MPETTSIIALGKRMLVLEHRQDLCDADRNAWIEWRKSIERNTAVTKDNTEMLEMIATAFKAMGWLSKALKWISVTGAAFAAIYATYKGFKLWP